MPELNEQLIQLIWQHRLLKPLPLTTISGKKLTVLRPGELNRDAGPDFFNARIQLAGLELAGNIEIHLRSSDWLRHGHQHNTAYDHLILHVVYEHDVDIKQNVTNNVEVLELKPLIAAETLTRYDQLIRAQEKIPCSGQLQRVSELKWTAWLQRMAIGRLEDKFKRLEDLFVESNSDYAQLLYITLLRNFGFHTNALPFELLARTLPFKLVLRHADQLFQLEALFFGMAGFLDQPLNDKYLCVLQNEFEFLKVKYGLIPLQKKLFKFSRLRPANFPTVRLAQLAVLIHSGSRLIHAPQEFESYTSLRKALSVAPAGYWEHHYIPDGNVVAKIPGTGNSSVDTIITNTFAPFFFFYSQKTAQPEWADLAMDLLSQCGFESNVKTRLFEGKKTQLKNSADSQGLIHLYDQYCSKKACLNCGIGVELLKNF